MYFGFALICLSWGRESTHSAGAMRRAISGLGRLRRPPSRVPRAGVKWRDHIAEPGCGCQHPAMASPNRLANETSPYLLQHAHNPVDWYPWSDEAFVRARAENKPVLLSIGYSACHWCHVMERESFDDPD